MSPDIETEILPTTGELIPVTVTHIDSCSRLYVSRKDENLQAELLQLMIKLNESAESLPLLDTPWEGCVCAAQYSKDNSWYRAQVETVCNSATCIVHFIDYGNSEETSLLKLRKIDPSFTRLPGQAIRCCLLGYEFSLDKATGDALKQSKSCSDGRQLEKLQLELLEKPVNVRVIKQHLDSWIVKMEDEHGECITGKFPPPGIHAISAPTISDLIFESPPEKEFDAVFTHMNNLNDFYCQRLDVEDLSELESLGHQLKDDMSKLGADIPCEPVKGGIYVSEFHDSWYRCVVEKVLGQNVLVRYIDYGNCEEKLASELRPISGERLSTPVRLFRCKLYGVSPIDPNWTGQGMGEYKEMLEQHQPHMVIQGEDEDAFLVSLYILVGNEIVNVADDLVSINIAKSTEMKKDICPEEKRDLPASSGPSQQQRERHGEGEEEEDSEEVLQRKIQELQKQLEMSQKKKKSVNIKTSL